MFYTVFSTNDSPYMHWQSELLEYSWQRVRQDGVLVRLVATDDPSNLPVHHHAQCIATRLWDVHHETGDAYPIYNKPASLLEWVFLHNPEGTVLFVDPDCVFTKPVTRRVAPGSPVSQDWIDLHLSTPGPDHPFGFGKAFAALNDHCVRTDISIAPVMIPTLIHTRDLRKICARWLQLCSAIRQNVRNAEGIPLWESDMYAYLATCAEYELGHETASLGICTNWDPAKVPDAPIIHYCQALKGEDGSTVFSKHEYVPWTPIDTSVQAVREDGRALIDLINAFVDERNGVVRPLEESAVPAWVDGVKEGRVLDEILLENPKDGASLWLNATGKAVWERCDGSRSVDAIAEDLSVMFSAEPGSLTLDVRTIAAQLHKIGFLELR